MAKAGKREWWDYLLTALFFLVVVFILSAICVNLFPIIEKTFDVFVWWFDLVNLWPDDV